MSRAVGPAATVVVVDRGLAMRWTDGQSLFEKARSEARSAVATLGPEDPVTVLPCGPEVTPPTAPGLDRSEAREVLDKMRPAWSTADLGRCFEVAARALEESPTAGKRIVVVSAFTAGSLHLENPLPTLRGPNDKRIRPEMVLRDVARGHKVLPNHFLAEVKAEPARRPGPAVRPLHGVERVRRPGEGDPGPAVELAGRWWGRPSSSHPRRHRAGRYRALRGGRMCRLGHLSRTAWPRTTAATKVQAPRELRALVVNGAPTWCATATRLFLSAALTGPSCPFARW